MEQQYYAPAPKRSNWGLIIAIIVGVLFLCCAGLGGITYLGFKKITGTAGCVFTFSTLQGAVDRYEKDHGGKLPKAETWQDDLKPYYIKALPPKEQTGPFRAADAEGDWGCKESDGMTGVSFNSDLSGKDPSKLADAVNQVILFETAHPSKNQHGKYTKQDPTASPMIFNKPRGWFFINAENEIYTNSPEKGIQRIGRPMMNSGVHFETEINSSSGSDSKSGAKTDAKSKTKVDSQEKSTD